MNYGVGLFPAGFKKRKTLPELMDWATSPEGGAVFATAAKAAAEAFKRLETGPRFVFLAMLVETLVRQQNQIQLNEDAMDELGKEIPWLCFLMQGSVQAIYPDVKTPIQMQSTLEKEDFWNNFFLGIFLPWAGTVVMMPQMIDLSRPIGVQLPGFEDFSDAMKSQTVSPLFKVPNLAMSLPDAERILKTFGKS